jgi:hypothetical protein
MKTFGPAIKRFTSLSGLPQNEQASLPLMRDLLEPMIACPGPRAQAQPCDAT